MAEVHIGASPETSVINDVWPILVQTSRTIGTRRVTIGGEQYAVGDQIEVDSSDAVAAIANDVFDQHTERYNLFSTRLAKNLGTVLSKSVEIHPVIPVPRRLYQGNIGKRAFVGDLDFYGHIAGVVGQVLGRPKYGTDWAGEEVGSGYRQALGIKREDAAFASRLHFPVAGIALSGTPRSSGLGELPPVAAKISAETMVIARTKSDNTQEVHILPIMSLGPDSEAAARLAAAYNNTQRKHTAAVDASSVGNAGARPRTAAQDQFGSPR